MKADVEAQAEFERVAEEGQNAAKTLKHIRLDKLISPNYYIQGVFFFMPQKADV